METIKIKLYPFGELSDTAKEVAVDETRCSDGYLWHEWWLDAYDCFIDYAKTEYGIDIDPKDICFSGFYHQGDGASFTGDIPLETLLKLYKESGIRIPMFEEIVASNITGYIEQTSSRYCHEKTVTVHLDICTYGCHRLEDKMQELEDYIESWKDDLCNKLYTMLENEYEYLTSYDCIAEQLGYDDKPLYTEDGHYFRYSA